MSESTEYCGVRCDPDRLVEIDHGRIMAVVKRSEILRIALDRGFQAPHPIRQAVVGVLLLGVGYFPARHLVDWFLHGGVMLGLELGLIAFAAMGVWILINALRSGYYLDVQLSTGQQRIAFSSEATAEGVGAFVQTIEEQLGLSVVRNIGGAFPVK
jgi:hypothetical protein